MAVYDIFLKNQHSDKIAQMMVKNNYRLFDYLIKAFLSQKSNIKVLEIGPGKGYFKDAVVQMKHRNKHIEYYAVDRNENILSNLNIDPKYTKIAEMPNIQSNKKFDIIFVGYVIEHLPSGVSLYEALSNLKTLLTDDGILVLQFPNAMRLRMEFYNIDYTHAIPTTKRNVNQAILDNAMYVKKAIDLCGILYTKKVDSKLRYFIRSSIMFFYSYRIMNILSKPFYHIPIWDLNNIFWRAYGLLKEPNVMFIIKKL